MLALYLLRHVRGVGLEPLVCGLFRYPQCHRDLAPGESDRSLAHGLAEVRVCPLLERRDDREYADGIRGDRLGELPIKLLACGVEILCHIVNIP